MRVVFQMNAIVAALALAGCGQRGALYLPVVPPLPTPENAAPATSTTSGEKPISASATTPTR